MMYRTKVEIVTNGKTYKPGSILPENISPSDMAFLKAKKFIVPVDAAPVVSEPVDDDPESDAENDGISGAFEGFNEVQPGKLKSESEIRKMRAKKEVRAYADSIGLDLGDDYEEKPLKELQEIVINFQDEEMSGEDSETEGE